MKQLKYWFTLALISLPAPVAAIDAPKGAAGGIESQTSVGSLQQFVTIAFTVLVDVFFPAVATIYLAISGYRYMVAQGNPDLIEKAKRSLTYAVFGVLVTYGAAALINLFARPLNFGTGF